ncbi:hypothetical protein SASPL_126747 [Salvia splendens]|uniref:Transmembrane protein n=1 Tax=Salvia splendens TaxID=180675 RepID=A0A8X8XG76_SALSN|nr:hypothetical protein SASPL_126747 [Salvia splendens]
MLRVSSIHLSPFVCLLPKPISALLPSLILPSSPLPISHRRTAHSSPIDHHNSIHYFTSKLLRFPGMSAPVTNLNATAAATVTASLFGIARRQTHSAIAATQQELLLFVVVRSLSVSIRRRWRLLRAAAGIVVAVSPLFLPSSLGFLLSRIGSAATVTASLFGIARRQTHSAIAATQQELLLFVVVRSLSVSIRRRWRLLRAAAGIVVAVSPLFLPSSLGFLLSRIGSAATVTASLFGIARRQTHSAIAATQQELLLFVVVRSLSVSIRRRWRLLRAAAGIVVAVSPLFLPSSLGFLLSRIGSSIRTSRSSEPGREILVQHLLVKEDDQKLLLELQKRAAEG